MTRPSSGRRRARLWAILAAACAVLACGKVGDPLPPLIEIPRPAVDLQAAQAAYQLRLSWTNPARNVDASEIRALDSAEILLDDELLAEIPAGEAGQPQTFAFDVSDRTGSVLELAIRFRAAGGELSAPSDPVAVEVIDVPGPMDAPRVRVDQGQIALVWEPPSGRVPADAYRIYRDGAVAADSVTETRFEDADFTRGETYVYSVVPLRRRDPGWVEGVASAPVTVAAVDRTPPSRPTGLVLTPTARGAFLQWEENPESDLARYRVYRRSGPAGSFEAVGGDTQTTTLFIDPAYQPGFQYAVSAVDRDGNESERSEAVGG